MNQREKDGEALFATNVHKDFAAAVAARVAFLDTGIFALGRSTMRTKIAERLRELLEHPDAQYTVDRGDLLEIITELEAP